jgi:HEAT repeat protein
MSREPEVKLTRASALMQLARFDRSARGAQMALLTAVGDKEPFVRATAVQSLATWVGDDLVTAKTVLEHLDDPDLRVRYAAYEALRGLSPPPIELLPILEKLILSEDATKSRVGAELAARMGQNAVEAADELWQAHQHHEANQVSMVFVSALASVAPSSAEARNAVAMLIRALEEGTKSRQLRAVELLGAFQVHASDALPALRHAIESEDAALSRAARDALRRIEAGAGEAAVQVVPQV